MKTPEAIVLTLFKATDLNNWPIVENCFAAQVELDYSSMGSNKAILSPNEITNVLERNFTWFYHYPSSNNKLEVSFRKQ